MKKTKFDIVSVGSCMRDIVFNTDQAELIKNPKADPTKIYLLGFEYGAKIKSDHVHYFFGGGAANTAVNFSGMGLKAAVATCLGKDGLGQEIKKNLLNKKVNTTLIQCSKKLPSGISFLVIDEISHEHVVFASYGANNDFIFANNNFETTWYYISSLSSTKWPSILEKIIQQKKLIAWNPGVTQLKAGYLKLKKFISKTDVLILNKDEAIELCLSAGIALPNWELKKIAEVVWSMGTKISLITDGMNGAGAYYGGKYYFVKPHHLKAIDTTGAGDCFGSTFIAGLIKTKGNIEIAMKLAIANTSSLVFKPGAQAGLLSWKQLKKKIC